jgi:DNA-binding transcriptional ArsR family regulator
MPIQNGHSLNGHSGSREIPVNAAENGRQGSPSIPVNWERLARATAHPLRVSILEILGLDGGRVLSPSDLSHELQIPLSNTNYHVTELAKSALIELVRERQVRGATEHFYRLPAEADGGKAERVSEAEAEPEEEARPPLAAAA